MLGIRKMAFAVGSVALVAALVQSGGEEPEALAQGGTCPTTGANNPKGAVFCNDFDSCKAFCGCACTFDVHKWTGASMDESTKCPSTPATGVGVVANSDPSIVDVPEAGKPFKYIVGRARATKQALEGLQKLDAHLAASPTRAQYDYKVKIKRCHEEVRVDVEKECRIMMSAAYMVDKHPEQAAHWKASNPVTLGLTWPGATPHSSGGACDLVLVDKNGTESFGAYVGAKEPSSSIDQKLASKMLDEELTAVGAYRLNYEAWHYSFVGAPNSCYCQAPKCNDEHWPPTRGQANCTLGRDHRH